MQHILIIVAALYLLSCAQNPKTQDAASHNAKTPQVQTAASIIQAAEDFMSWLKQNEAGFAACQVQKNASHFVLCDNTQVSIEELKSLFQMSPTQLIEFVKSKGIKVEILCDEFPTKGPFKEGCLSHSPRKEFIKLTALHAQYLPNEKTILLRSSATPGTLIHEYLHFLQAENSATIYGRVYKKERLMVQNNLVSIMDDSISNINSKDVATGSFDQTLSYFMRANDIIRSFADWQDLIDERSIFLLYLNYAKELGAPASDVALAKKNMGFICKSKAWAKKLPKAQCS